MENEISFSTFDTSRFGCKSCCGNKSSIIKDATTIKWEISKLRDVLNSDFCGKNDDS